ncbi:MAG TPA: sulfur oxidation c-type cytochrome SoxA [Usitatibacter sp.]|jgi:sulfur-oxidizing protein SoxA|nr:sulfur oxidation c-type cytochrome SoxA [Usitatibacter sp.]
MRFRDALIAMFVAAPLLAGAAAEQVRAEIASRLQQQLPTLSIQDYGAGGAAFDEALRAQVDQNSGAAALLVEAGHNLWTAKFRDGKSLAGCFPNGGRRIAGHYPLYDARVKRVVTLEMAINQCRKAHGEALFDQADPQTMGAIEAYVRSLSNGQKMAVRVPAAAQARFEEGRRMYFTRMGQRNFACASCHVQGAGKHYEDEALSPAIGQATHWPEIRDGAAVTLQARMRECLERMGAAPFAAGSDELNDLEYFLSYLSNGLPLNANPWRPK